MNIDFCLANTDPDGNKINGIIRKRNEKNISGSDTAIFYSDLGGSNAWNTEKFLNIWAIDLGNNLLGYSIYPWSRSAGIDGVVINSKYLGKQKDNTRFNLGRTLVHEVGHYLGLYHLWDNSGCEQPNDHVEDTPPQEKGYNGLLDYPQFSCGHSSMFMNYMDYVNDEQLLFFTKGQVERVKACIALYRQHLASDKSICHTFSERYIDFEIFPNPASDNINVRYPNSANSKTDMYLYDIRGRILIKSSIENQEEISIDVSGFSKGVYFLKIGFICKKISVI